MRKAIFTGPARQIATECRRWQGARDQRADDLQMGQAFGRPWANARQAPEAARGLECA
jgi:hypothetical protein